MMILLYVLLALAALLIVGYLYARSAGARYPPDHHFTEEITLAAAPEKVWAAVSDFAHASSWNPTVKRSQREPDREGHEVWREWLSSGPVLMLTKESEAPRRLVREIVDNPQFGGTWTFVLEPAGAGTRLRISEDGVVPSPLFRFVMHKLGPGRTIRLYLNALVRHLGEPVR